MVFVDFKEVNITNPGSSIQYGADDLLDVMKIFNGKTATNRQVRIKNPFQFIDHLEIVQPTSLPSSPPSGTRYIVVDPADGHLKVMKTGGTMIDLDNVIASNWNPTLTETVQNKTLQVDLNTVSHSTTNSAGELLVNNGTKYNRKAKGAALQILRTNSGATDIEWVDPTMITGGGETNTVSNIGTGVGLVGIYKQKTGVNFELKSLFPASSNMLIVDDVGNNRITLDVNTSGITLGSLAGAITLPSQITGTLGVPNGGTGTTSLTGLLKGSGTSAFSAIANGTTGQILTMVGGNPSWSTPANPSNTAFYPDNTKWGGFWGGATSGTGLFAGANGYGDSIVGDQSSATDNFTTFITNNSDAEIAGFVTPCSITRRDYNPVLNYRFKVGELTHSHVWMGFQSSAVMGVNASADSPLDGITGLLFGFSDVHANFQVTYNAGAATGTFISTSTAKNSSVHDLQLEFDNTSGKIKVTFDGTVITPAGTSNTPATTTPLFVHFNVEAVGSNAESLSLNYAKIIQTE